MNHEPWFKPQPRIQVSEIPKLEPIFTVWNFVGTKSLQTAFVYKTAKYPEYFVFRINERTKGCHTSIAVSRGSMINLLNSSLRFIFGEIKMDNFKGKVGIICDYLFRRTRSKGKTKYVHRTIIMKLLEKKTVFASEIMRDQDIGYPLAWRAVHEMERDGIIIHGKDMGKIRPYTFTVDAKDVEALVKALDSWGILLK